MSIGTLTLIKGLIAIGVGAVGGYIVSLLLTNKKVASARDRAEKLVNEDRQKAQDLTMEAKEKSLQILEEAKKDEQKRNEQLSRIENLLSKKESEIDRRARELDQHKAILESKIKETDQAKSDLEVVKQEQVVQLEKIAGLGKEQGKELLLTQIEDEYRDELYLKMKKQDQINRDELENKAREILTMSVQRYAGSHIADATTTVVSLPSDEVKGKIIGKEGRNIKTIERLTGVDIIIDDTPEALVISGFVPVCRQIASIAIENLL